MEICILILLYFLSQNPDFNESVKPIMYKLNNSQHILSFLNELSNFAQTFGTGQCGTQERKEEKKEEKKEEPCTKEEKKSQSPTAGIANEFIQQILEKCLARNIKQ